MFNIPSKYYKSRNHIYRENLSQSFYNFLYKFNDVCSRYKDKIIKLTNAIEIRSYRNTMQIFILNHFQV